VSRDELSLQKDINNQLLEDTKAYKSVMDKKLNEERFISDKYKEAVSRIESKLISEREEREDAVKRLLEYESRLIGTCEAIHCHEQNQEQEMEELREICESIDNKLKEEQARNSELLKLVQEKNEALASLACEVKTHRSAEDNRVSDLLDEINESILSRSAQNTSSNGFTHSKSSLEKNRSQFAIASTANNQHDNEIRELNSHTKSIHDDIRSLQQKLMNRLQQVPIHVDRSYIKQNPLYKEPIFKGPKKSNLRKKSSTNKVKKV